MISRDEHSFHKDNENLLCKYEATEGSKKLTTAACLISQLLSVYS